MIAKLLLIASGYLGSFLFLILFKGSEDADRRAEELWEEKRRTNESESILPAL